MQTGRWMALALGGALVAGCAKEAPAGGGGPADGHGAATGAGHVAEGPVTEKDVPATPTLAGAVRALEALGMKLDAHVAAGTLGKVHRVAEEAALVANRAVERVQAEAPPERRAEATKAARAVAAMFADLDKAGDAGDKAGVAALLGVYRGHVAVLRGALPAGADAGHPAHAVAIDPVCQMEVEITPDALRHEHGGTTYYFCNAECRERFAAKPADFLK